MQRIPGICLNGVKLPRDEIANISPDDRRFARKVEEWVHSEPRPEKRTLLGEVWHHMASQYLPVHGGDGACLRPFCPCHAAAHVNASLHLQLLLVLWMVLVQRVPELKLTRTVHLHKVC
jgi:hypothetical protein